MKKEIAKHWEKLYTLIDKNARKDAALYCKRMKREEYEKIEKSLLHLLEETKDTSIRNTIAILLRDLHCNAAILVLISLLSDERCKNDCETLVYALEDLDCADYIVKFFPLLYEGNYEVKLKMCGVLKEKWQCMSEEDLAICKEKLIVKKEQVTKDLNFLHDTLEELFGVDFEKEEEEIHAKVIKKHWEKLYTLIDKNARDNAVLYCKQMKKVKYQEIEKKLLYLLKETNDACIRNATAMILGDLHCNAATPVLISLLADERCKNCRGSLIHAFEGLDCADRIVEFFPLLYEGNCEVRMNMHYLLLEKIQCMNKRDIVVCKEKLMIKMEQVEEDLNFLYDTAEELFGVDFKKEEEEENAGGN